MTLRTRGMFRNCVIAIESSCDDSSLAILNNKNKIIYELNSSQKNTHQPFGGIVPQLAAQGHKAAFTRFIEDRLLKRIIKTKSVKYIALTTGPGIGNCLSVGYEFAAFLSRSQNIPVIPINHLQGHCLSVSGLGKIDYPHVTLLVSGGNTQIVFSRHFGMYTVLGETIDDAVGEAIDKTARLLNCNWELAGGLGRSLEILAEKGVAKNVIDVNTLFTVDSPVSFSFSGLKTALKSYIVENFNNYSVFDLAATVQKTFFDHLVSRVRNCFDVMQNSNIKIKQFSVVGGVSCNTSLQEMLKKLCISHGAIFSVPPSKLCTDNAVMIGMTANEIIKRGKVYSDEETTRPNPNWTLEELGIERAKLD